MHVQQITTFASGGHSAGLFHAAEAAVKHKKRLLTGARYQLL